MNVKIDVVVDLDGDDDLDWTWTDLTIARRSEHLRQHGDHAFERSNSVVARLLDHDLPDLEHFETCSTLHRFTAVHVYVYENADGNDHGSRDERLARERASGGVGGHAGASSESEGSRWRAIRNS